MKIEDQIFTASNSLLKICIHIAYNINFQYLQRILEHCNIDNITILNLNFDLFLLVSEHEI